MAMTRRERLMAALQLRQPDRVPMFDFLFQKDIYEVLISRRPESYNSRDAADCALALEHDGVWIPFGGFSGFEPEILDEKTYIDEWGTTYKRDEASWPIDAPIDYPIKSRQDMAKYRIRLLFFLQNWGKMSQTHTLRNVIHCNRTAFVKMVRVRFNGRLFSRRITNIHFQDSPGRLNQETLWYVSNTLWRTKLPYLFCGSVT